MGITAQDWQLWAGSTGQPQAPPFTTHCLALPTGEQACDCGSRVRMMNSMEKKLYLKSLENLELIILQRGTDKSVSNNECCREGMP